MTNSGLIKSTRKTESFIYALDSTVGICFTLCCVVYIAVHKRHGSATDLDDHLSFISDTDSNDPSRMSRRQAPRRHTLGGDDLENGERGDKNGDVSIGC